MKKYLAIGHWGDDNNTTCVASTDVSVKSFRQNLGGNDFIPYVVITEDRMKKLEGLDSFDIFYEVKKMTSNYRKWNEIADYIAGCFDIMSDKLALA